MEKVQNYGDKSAEAITMAVSTEISKIDEIISK